MANIQRLSKGIESYRITVSLGYGMNGKQIRKTMTWRPDPNMTPKQIEKALRRQADEFETKCQNGTLLDDSVKFYEFAEKWIADHAKKELRTLTVEGYESMLPRINLAIGNLRLSEIKPLHLKSFYNSLAESGVRKDTKYKCIIDFKQLLKEKGYTKASFSTNTGTSISVLDSVTQGKNIAEHSAEKICKSLQLPIRKMFEPVCADRGLSGKTILHHHRLISAILSTAVEWDILLANPCDRVKPPRAEKSKQIILQVDEAARMLQLLEDEPPQYRVMITMLIFTGLRRGELCGLEWQDIDFEAKQITVERSCLCSREKGVFTDATKNEFSKRTLETSDLVFSLLYKHRTSQIEQKLLMGDRWRDCNRVFTAQDGNPFHPDTLTNWFSSFTKKNNLPDVHIHSMRHTHASFLIAQGIPITTVAKKLGHSNSYTLLSTYAHAVENGERVVAQTMDNILPLKEKGAV